MIGPPMGPGGPGPGGPPFHVYNGVPPHPGGTTPGGSQLPPQVASLLSQYGGAGKGSGAPIQSPMLSRQFKRGGGVKFTGGAESGEGRLEKAQRQKRRG